MMKLKKRYGKWTVIGNSSVPRYVMCRCDCGRKAEVFSSSLTTGVSMSCGCGRGKASITHGMSKTELYRRWRDMINRCTNKSVDSYKQYGGRGITFEKAWYRFANFKDWALSNGYLQGLSIDRIDVNGNYEPKNCRWIRANEQCKNKQNSMWVTAFGERKILSDWARDKRCHVNRATVWLRLKNGVQPEKALTHVGYLSVK